MVVQFGVECESGARKSEDDRADYRQDPFVEAITHCAAPERTGDEDGELDETRQSDPETRMGLAVDLIRHGDDGQVAAKLRADLTGVQQSKVAVLAQWAHVNEEPGHPGIVRG